MLNSALTGITLGSFMKSRQVGMSGSVARLAEALIKIEAHKEQERMMAIQFSEEIRRKLLDQVIKGTERRGIKFPSTEREGNLFYDMAQASGGNNAVSEDKPSFNWESTSIEKVDDGSMIRIYGADPGVYGASSGHVAWINNRNGTYGVLQSSGIVWPSVPVLTTKVEVDDQEPELSFDDLGYENGEIYLLTAYNEGEYLQTQFEGRLIIDAEDSGELDTPYGRIEVETSDLRPVQKWRINDRIIRLMIIDDFDSENDFLSIAPKLTHIQGRPTDF